jgi:hypothetical protein
MSASGERLARNQALYRDVNERIQDLADGEGMTEFADELGVRTCPLGPHLVRDQA